MLNKCVNFMGLQSLNANNVTAPMSRVTSDIADMTLEHKALLFAEISILAYFNLTDAKKWADKLGFTEVNRISIKDDLCATILCNENDRVIAFRGSQTYTNIEEIFSIDLMNDGVLKGQAHRGFLTSFNKIWAKIEPLLDTQKKVWVTGHSLGGAHAAIAAVRAARRVGPNMDGIFTFGQPRIGNAAYVSNLGTEYFRWVNHHDPVPLLPSKWLKYRHAGRECYIKGGRYHERNFIFRFLAFLGSALNFVPQVLGDHDVTQYRDELMRSNQESANGQR